MDTLETLDALEELLGRKSGTVVLFKHSTQCPISAEALEEFQALVEARPAAAHYVYLDLLSHRDVSDAIAARLGVRHESPQAIVLKEGRVARVFNHRAIRKDALAKEMGA